jgi:hypothetical protein
MSKLQIKPLRVALKAALCAIGMVRSSPSQRERRRLKLRELPSMRSSSCATESSLRPWMARALWPISISQKGRALSRV